MNISPPTTKVRLRYAKLPELRYLSHLELARSLERALRRASLPVAMSQGFNPHPKLTLGSVLPVGIGGCAEYLDIAFTDFIEPEELVLRLNATLPAGIRVLEAGLRKEPSASIQSCDQIAGYIIKFDSGTPESRVDNLRGLSELSVLRKGKEVMLDDPNSYMVDVISIGANQLSPGCICGRHNSGGCYVQIRTSNKGGGLKVSDVLQYLGEVDPVTGGVLVPTAARTHMMSVVDGTTMDPALI